MTRYELFMMIMRRTAGTLGVMILICWLFLLVGLRLLESALPEDTLPTPNSPPTFPNEQEPVKTPPIDESRPNCIRMEDGNYVCERPEVTND